MALAGGGTLIPEFLWFPHQTDSPTFSCKLRTMKKQIHHLTPTLPATPPFLLFCYCCSGYSVYNNSHPCLCSSLLQ